MVNDSQCSTTTLVVKLFDGRTSTQIGSTFFQTLAPLGHVQSGFGALFPAFTGSSATNAYVTVEQVNNTPVTGDAFCTAACPNGCPAFFAYGSVLDNLSGDATTLEPQYLKGLTNAAVACIYNQNCKVAPLIRRAVRH
jgi:hypothetical protein